MPVRKIVNWSSRRAGFRHAGRQCYAHIHWPRRALIHLTGYRFNWRGYSPFAHDVHRREMGQTEALMIRVQRLMNVYTVTDLSSESSEYELKVPP